MVYSSYNNNNNVSLMLFEVITLDFFIIINHLYLFINIFI